MDVDDLETEFKSPETVDAADSVASVTSATSVSMQSVDSGDMNACTSDANDSGALSMYEIERATKYKIKRLVYTEQEHSMIDQFMQFATDDNVHSWKSIASDTEDFSMEYVDSNDSSQGICIARGTTVIDCNPEDLFFGYDDYSKIKDLDENCLEVQLKHKYDDHRRIISSSFHAPTPAWNREFVFKEMRSIIDDKGKVICTKFANDEKEDEVIDVPSSFAKVANRGSVCLGYSMEPEDCPFEDKVRDRHVRCHLKFGGYFFRSIGDNKSKAIYLVCMDLKGWIPTWFQNFILPQQAKNILTMKKYIEEMAEKMKKTKVKLAANSSSENKESTM